LPRWPPGEFNINVNVAFFKKSTGELEKFCGDGFSLEILQTVHGGIPGNSNNPSGRSGTDLGVN